MLPQWAQSYPHSLNESRATNLPGFRTQIHFPKIGGVILRDAGKNMADYWRLNGAFFLDMERRWLSLAHSYEFSERLSNFTTEAKRYIRKK